jgi:heme/copper-type cytochrome/quinol oxidase subunit 2
MSAATRTYRHLQHVHVSTTWIIAVLAVVVITAAAITLWDRSSAASGPTPAQIHLTPAPVPGPIADLARIIVS